MPEAVAFRTDLIKLLNMIWTTLLHELRQQSHSSAMPIFTAGFLMFLNAGVFFIGNFLNSNLATLDLQWQFLIWISVLLVPAMAMRAFQSHETPGSINLLLSLPLPGPVVIFSKWLSGTLLLLGMLTLTFPLIITIAFLGQPDWGVVFAGYLGAALFLASLYAVAMLAAAISREKVSSFLLGIALILGLLVFDIEKSLLILLPDQMSEFLRFTYALSPKYWFQETASGEVTLEALMYFFMLCLISLWISSRQFEALRRPKVNRVKEILLCLAVFMSFVGANAGLVLFVSKLDIGVDVTEQREFTLNTQTKDIAENLPKTTNIQLFFNERLADVPPTIRDHHKRVVKLLKRIEKLSKGRVEVEFIALSEDTELAELAEMSGISAVPMSSGDTLYFGAVFKADSRQLVINYLDYKRAALLEYDVAVQLSNLSRQRTHRVGVLSSFLKPKNAHEPHPSFSILEELKSQYDVIIVPYFNDALPEDIDVLIVIDAPVLRQGMLKAIDAHINSGLGALFLVDPYQRMNEANASLVINASKKGEINTLTDLLNAYGLMLSHDKIVGDDLNSSLVQSDSGDAYPFPYWLQIGPNNISSEHPVTVMLTRLLFAEAGHFEIAEGSKSLYPIVSTSTQTAELHKREIKLKGADVLAANFSPKTNPPRNLVVYVDGYVKPAFVESQKALNKSSASFFAVADADWIYNGYSMTEAQVGGVTMPKPINDNFSLFLNMVEFLTGDDRLLTIRSRGNPVRSFTRVEKMLSEARQIYRDREAEYLSQISRAETSIAEVLRMTGAANREQLPEDLRKQVIQLQALAYPLKRDLRALRREMREKVDTLFRNAIIFNLSIGPLIVVGLSLILRNMRRKQTRQSKIVA